MNSDQHPLQQDYDCLDNTPEKLDFNKLKLVDHPVDASRLQQTLEGCTGYLEALPLIPPNGGEHGGDVDRIVDLINADLPLPSGEEGSTIFQEDEYMNPTEHKKTYHKESWLGRTVLPNCFSLYQYKNLIYAAPKGKWKLKKGKWLNQCHNIQLNFNDDYKIMTENQQLLIVRILEGQLGLVSILGSHYILDVGCHVFNSGQVQFHTLVNLKDQPYFRHGPYHSLRVPRGKLAMVWVELEAPNGVLVPRFLQEGCHAIRSTLFQYDGMIDLAESHKSHGNGVHMVNVVKGHVAKVIMDNRPHLLGEGLHFLESTNFHYQGMCTVSPDSPVIQHGTLTIVEVPHGQVAKAWHQDEATLLEKPGLYEFNSPNFHFVGLEDCSCRVIQLGSKKIILVNTGEVAVTYKDGDLVILTEGRHVIESATHVFDRFVSLQQRTTDLPKPVPVIASFDAPEEPANDEEEDANNKDYLICQTHDLVKMGLQANVVYAIQNAELCVTTLDNTDDKLEELIRDASTAALTGIVSKTLLEQIVAMPHHDDEDEPEEEGETLVVSKPTGEIVATVTLDEDDGNNVIGGSTNDNSNKKNKKKKSAKEEHHEAFLKLLREEFMAQVKEDFLTKYGVEISTIHIESLKVLDTDLAEEIAQQCLAAAQNENEIANLEAQNIMTTQKELTAAECVKIQAEAEAQALAIKTEAENKARIAVAKAEAEAESIRRAALIKDEADAIIEKGRAEAEAIRLKASAEAERARLLSHTDFGMKACLFEIYADMVKASNEGVNKCVYMDPSLNKDSPLAIKGIDGLNRDLKAIERLAEDLENKTHNIHDPDLYKPRY